MTSHAIPRFWRLFHGLPPEAQRLASKTFGLWQTNPNHPSLLAFKFPRAHREVT